MCSISGVIQVGKSKRGRDQLRCAVERMNVALRHRGPDDHGIIEVVDRSTDTFICLGNTRLSIIDTSNAGHQPMRDPDTGNWITYNGETYNFRQLRSQLAEEFGPWRSNSDTEVVLRAYRKWGVKAFAKLRGMFALAIWDEALQQLVVARDAFGIKPLYCYFGEPVPPTNNRRPTPTKAGSSERLQSNPFLFASEVRALLASGFVPPRLSRHAVSSFLEYGSVQAPLTMVENVWSVMPGTYLKVKADHEGRLFFAVSDFKNTTLQSPTSQPATRSEATVMLRSLLEDSVREHLVSDVPLGVFLSGGMDSSALVALINQVSGERPKTFSVVFDEDQFNESHYSRTVAKRFSTDHCEVKLTEQSLLDALPSALRALDQPTMDGVNTFVVSKAVKEAGVTVALSGLGGDELFGGYPSFRRALKLSAANKFTRRTLRSLGQASKVLGRGSTQREKFRQLALQNDPHDVYRISRQLFSPESVTELSGKSACGNGFMDHESVRFQESDIVNAISQLELNGYMANTLLRDTDAMSMAHSLEVRVPLIDTEVVRYVLTLPGEWKLGTTQRNTPKPLLAEAVADLLPSEFLARRKMGFTIPFERWLGSELRDEVTSVLNDPLRLANAGTKQEPVLEMWNRFLRQPKAVGWSRPWAIYVLAKWCEANQVGVADGY